MEMTLEEKKFYDDMDRAADKVAWIVCITLIIANALALAA